MKFDSICEALLAEEKHSWVRTEYGESYALYLNPTREEVALMLHSNNGMRMVVVRDGGGFKTYAAVDSILHMDIEDSLGLPDEDVLARLHYTEDSDGRGGRLDNSTSSARIKSSTREIMRVVKARMLPPNTKIIL